MLGEISSYYVNNSASVRVITQAGVDRPATDGEWLALWRTQPALTLEIGIMVQGNLPCLVGTIY